MCHLRKLDLLRRLKISFKWSCNSTVSLPINLHWCRNSKSCPLSSCTDPSTRLLRAARSRKSPQSLGKTRRKPSKTWAGSCPEPTIWGNSASRTIILRCRINLHYTNSSSLNSKISLSSRWQNRGKSSHLTWGSRQTQEWTTRLNLLQASLTRDKHSKERWPRLPMEFNMSLPTSVNKSVNRLNIMHHRRSRQTSTTRVSIQSRVIPIWPLSTWSKVFTAVSSPWFEGKLQLIRSRPCHHQGRSKQLRTILITSCYRCCPPASLRTTFRNK